MSNRFRFAMSAAALLVAALIAAPAHAAITVQLDSVAPSTLYPGNYDWTYAVTIPTTDGIRHSYITFYDVAGLVALVPATDWGADDSATGPTPAGLSPTDDPAILNVTFDSGTLSRPGYGTPIYFKVISAYSTSRLGEYTWQDRDTYPDGVDQSGLGSVEVPSSAVSPPAIPEPASATLALVGVAALLARRRRAA